MHYDVAIIGAGMSGLGAGIRCAYFDKKVCILERHYAFGGLNSYYTLDGREFDVGLHAVTNFAPPGVRHAPLNKLLRQLRIPREDFQLLPQRFSEVRFPTARLRFGNGIGLLTDEVTRAFPREVDGFTRLRATVLEFDDATLEPCGLWARDVLGGHLRDPRLIDMLLCPIMYYGSAHQHDIDFRQFVVMFKALFFEGMARPRDGVRTLIKVLVKKFRACGGRLKMRCGVESINIRGSNAVDITLSNGDSISADTVISSAGAVETMRLCSDASTAADSISPGVVSFVESIAAMDRLPQTLGHEAAIVFFNDTERFTYAKPDDPVDLRSGVICCPSNYDGHDDMKEGIFRVTWLANSDYWESLAPDAYATAKRGYLEHFIAQGNKCMPGFDSHVVHTDMFTPRTIRRFTGHINGAVYGTTEKVLDGRTRIDNLFLCGTDQGYLGIIGAILSGITIANMHVLSER